MPEGFQIRGESPLHRTGTTARLIFGIGGCGCNLVSGIQRLIPRRADFLFANTDAQALRQYSADGHLLLGPQTRNGRGCDSSVDYGRRSAEECRAQIAAIIKGYRAVFLVAGLGGGCGSGALPVIADLARAHGLAISILVTMPFPFEGKARMDRAEATLRDLRLAGHDVTAFPNRIEDQAGSRTMIDLLSAPAYAMLDRIGEKPFMTSSPQRWRVLMDG